MPKELRSKTIKLNSNTVDALDALKKTGINVSEMLREVIDKAILEEKEKMSPISFNAFMAELKMHEKNGRAHSDDLKSKPKAVKRAEKKVEQFTYKDWLKYIDKLLASRGIMNKNKNQYACNAVMRAVMKEYEPSVILAMIDFICTSDQNHFDITSGNVVNCLSSGWISTTFNNTLLWERGEYVKKPEKQVKESNHLPLKSQRQTPSKKALTTRTTRVKPEPKPEPKPKRAVAYTPSKSRIVKRGKAKGGVTL